MGKKILMDFDGPINANANAIANRTVEVTEANKSSMFIKLSDETTTQKQRKAGKSVGEKDIVINNLAFLHLTLEILSRNNVEVILGSQRIHMSDKDEYHGPLKNEMFVALDDAFGKKRKFLVEETARTLGKQFEQTKTNSTKVPLLNAIQEEQTLPRNIILIDDNDRQYKKTTEDAEYNFIHAPRASNLSQDNQYYLFEALIQTVPLDQIMATLNVIYDGELHGENENTAVTEVHINQFKQTFFDYLISHAYQVRTAQVALASAQTNQLNRSLKDDKKTDREVTKDILGSASSLLSPDQAPELIANNFSESYLINLKKLIETTQWKTGTIGGEPIRDLKGKEMRNKNDEVILVPKRVAKIHALILENQKSPKIKNNGSKDWSSTFDEVARIGAKAANSYNTFFGLNKRDSQTQTFYDTIKKGCEENKTTTSQIKPPMGK